MLRHFTLTSEPGHLPALAKDRLLLLASAAQLTAIKKNGGFKVRSVGWGLDCRGTKNPGILGIISILKGLDESGKGHWIDAADWMQRVVLRWAPRP